MFIVENGRPSDLPVVSCAIKTCLLPKCYLDTQRDSCSRQAVKHGRYNGHAARVNHSLTRQIFGDRFRDISLALTEREKTLSS